MLTRNVSCRQGLRNALAPPSLLHWWCLTESRRYLPKESRCQLDELGRDRKKRPRTGRWLIMVSVEYCVLEVGMGLPNIVRRERCVLQSKGACDSFQQRAYLTVKV